MQKDWFPFFSMMFWFFTKVIGLFMVVFSLSVLAGMARSGFNFWDLLLSVAAPLVLGYLLLATEIAFDLGTAEMKRRAPKS